MAQPPGRDEQFGRWVADHVEVLYRVAYRLLGDPHDAEDVVQEAFRSAWVSRHRFDAGRSERAWLLAILRRRAADHWRKTDGRQQCATDRMTERVAPADPDPFGDELSAVLQRALDALPRELRETLLLVVVGGLTHQEAADLLGVPLGTVLSRVSRARGRLRETLLAATDGHVASARRGRSHD